MKPPDLDELANVLNEAGTTDDPLDPRLHMAREDGQNKKYLVLSEEERSKGYVRPFRDKYIHEKCGVETRMGFALSETYAANPSFYSHTFCVRCGTHYPVAEFKWSKDDQIVGS
jgi:hypothetical protein